MSTETTDSTPDSPMPPEAKCMNFEDCENAVPGGAQTGNGICVPCLRAARYRDSNQLDESDV